MNLKRGWVGLSWGQGMNDGCEEIKGFLEQWQMDATDLRRRVMLAPTHRERERWYDLSLLAQGLTASATDGAGKGFAHPRKVGRSLRRG